MIIRRDEDGDEHRFRRVGIEPSETGGFRSVHRPLPSRDPLLRSAERRGPESGGAAMRVKDVLRRKGDSVFTISPKDTVSALLDALAEHKVGALVVVTSDGRLEGIVSERDVVRPLKVRGAGVLDEPISVIMT